VSLDDLKCHEAISKDRLQTIIRDIRSSEIFRSPILVDRDTNVILDGHHRYHALREIGTDKIPVRYVDYPGEDSISVESRANCPLETLTKDDVIKMGLSDEVFPFKSTKHRYEQQPEDIDIPLDKLM
jgi:hypothetical protein